MVVIISKKFKSIFPFDRNGSLDAALKVRPNNLNFIRLCAAILVIVDHAFPLGGKPHWLATRIGFTLGEFAVLTFFFLSGLLIAKSWDDNPNIVSFSLKRILRIFPGFWVAIGFCTFIIGPLTTTLSLNEYLSNKGTWSYALHNALLFPIRYSLPGVFENNPYPVAVNGSIWSLPLEFFAYGIVMVIGILGAIKYRYVGLLILGCLLYVNIHMLPYGKLQPETFLLMPTLLLWTLLLPFLFGVICYSFKDKIVLNANWSIVALSLFVLSFATPYVTITKVFLWGYFLLCVGFQNWNICQKATKYGDFSYGIYIYAFPIQQYYYYLFPNMTPWANIALSIPTSYFFGMLSWKLIEHPALSLKKYLGKRQNPVPVENIRLNTN